MSWPDDGEPRFIVTSVTGFGITADSGKKGGRPPATAFQVLDRAYAHRVVREWRPDPGHRPRGDEPRRRCALALADELNADEAA